MTGRNGTPPCLMLANAGAVVAVVAAVAVVATVAAVVAAAVASTLTSKQLMPFD